MTHRPPRPKFHLTLEVQPDREGHDPTGVHRLKAFLKAALRFWRLKCLDARRVEPPATQLLDAEYAYPLPSEARHATEAAPAQATENPASTTNSASHGTSAQPQSRRRG